MVSTISDTRYSKTAYILSNRVTYFHYMGVHVQNMFGKYPDYYHRKNYFVIVESFIFI